MTTVKGPPLFQVDAFADRPFQGNPAAVCILDEVRDAAWMQAVAAEMNLSETAFLQRRGPGRWALRWFTPATEVDLCGHATLASAHVLWSEGLEDVARIRFATRSGELRADRDEDGRIVLDFPALQVVACESPTGLEEALGAEVVWVGRGGDDLLVELAGDPSLRALRPDVGRIAELPFRGLIVTALSDDADHEVVSRFFAPAVGVDEDPVTGSAHCALGPYWSAKLGKRTLRCYQASRRGGSLELDVGPERVFLRGRATTVLRGNWLGD